MGLGTFIDYKTPVMDNDCRFNVTRFLLFYFFFFILGMKKIYS